MGLKQNLINSSRFWTWFCCSWQDLIQNSLTAFSFTWKLCYKSLILLGDVVSSFSATEVDCCPQVELEHFLSRRWGNARWKSRIETWVRRGWKNWPASFVGLLFSTLVAKFQFWPLFPPIYNMSTCPVLGSGGVVGWGRSQWVCCPWQPLACSSLLPALPPVTGQGEMLNSACKQLTCSTALQLCFSSDAAQACTQGWDF